MLNIAEVPKPSNAGWVSKVGIDPDAGTVKMHQGAGVPVEVAWYPDGRIKVTVIEGTPMVIRQAYLTGKSGQDAIIELALDSR